MERRFQHLAATGSAPACGAMGELAWTQKALPGDSAHQARSSSAFAALLERLGKRRG